MSEYPEHIDQIDDFYRNQLADHEIAPPEGLWEKISAGAFETNSPESTAGSSSASLLTKTQKIMGFSAAAVMVVVGAFYFYSINKGDNASNNDPTYPIEQHEENHLDSTDPQNEQPTEPSGSTVTPADKKTNPTSGTANAKKDKETRVAPVEQNTIQDTKTETPINTVVTEEHKKDSLQEIKTAPVLPKEKVKFKDKYKKDYQDSTRKIFVPGK